MGVGDVNMKCAGDVAKGYVLAWDVAAGYALAWAARGWPAECIGGIAGAALCDMEITLCNCTYVQFFL